MEFTNYKFSHMLPDVLRVAQEELSEFLSFHRPEDFADITWFETQYGHKLDKQEIMRLWYAIPNLRAGKETEWSNKLPKLTEIAKSLPGIVNFSLNAIAPGGAVPEHSDYTYDMRKDLSGVDTVYVIVLGVSMPSTDITECGFKLGNTEFVINTGDIIAFDGSIPHSAWNKTNKWRYTINMDIESGYWDVNL